MNALKLLRRKTLCAALLGAALFTSRADAQLGGTPAGATGGTGAMGGTGALGGGRTGGGGGGGGVSSGSGNAPGISASFAGGTAGTSFSGGLSFSGGNGGTGPGTSTQVGRIGGVGNTGGSILAPSIVNPFRTTYINPLSTGIYTIGGTGTTTAAATGTKAMMGQPTYTQVYGPQTTGTASPALGGSNLNLGTMGKNNGTGATGFNTYGTYRAPAYVTTLDESIPIVAHAPADVGRRVHGILLNSSGLKKVRNLDVVVDSGAVVLRGEVGTARERRLVEGMVRLTPGVRDVRNELTVAAP